MLRRKFSVALETPLTAFKVVAYPKQGSSDHKSVEMFIAETPANKDFRKQDVERQLATGFHVEKPEFQ